MTDEEEFYAWLDGELAPADAARVEGRAATDPALQRLALRHRALKTRLQDTFNPIAATQVPSSLRSAVRPSADVMDFAAAREAREQRSRPPLWKQAAAMAATLALGIAAGNALFSPSSAPVDYEAGRLVASAELEQALYTRLASVQADEGPRIGLTFRNGSGAICRTFTDEGASGLACQEGGDWRIRGLFQAPEGQQGDYRMAAGTDPQLAVLVDQTMAGEPFDAQAEKAAQESGWR